MYGNFYIKSKLSAFRLSYLLIPVIVYAVLRITKIGDFQNTYYTATAISIFESWSNFAFASFDHAGVVTVDKPPVFFWVQGLWGTLLGFSPLTMSLTSFISGTGVLLLTFTLIKKTYGRGTACIASLLVAIMPVSILLDTRNEPDGLLNLLLLFSIFCVFKSVKSGKLFWLMLFAILIGVGFNIKMWVAFIPVPSAIIYYLIASKHSIKYSLLNCLYAISVIVIISFSWVTMVGSVPTTSRPYIGSTQDNSIWTLVFKYNGIDRITRFSGPPSPIQLPYQNDATINRLGMQPPQQGMQPPQQGMQPPQQSMQPNIFNIFSKTQAGYLGWLMPLALIMGGVIFSKLLNSKVYINPLNILSLAKSHDYFAKSIFWILWLFSAIAVFGIANSTNSHPYYLVGISIPLCTVISIGTVHIYKDVIKGKIQAWGVPILILALIAYQINSTLNEFNFDLVYLIVITIGIISSLIVLIGLIRKLIATALMKAALVASLLSVMIIPITYATNLGGMLVGPKAGMNSQNIGVRENFENRSITRIIEFISSDQTNNATFMIATMTAKDASEFIIKDYKAVSVGGFAGRDPIFNVETFNKFIQDGNVNYFVSIRPNSTPLNRFVGNMPGIINVRNDISPNSGILADIIENWEDVSIKADLPYGTLYRYKVSNNE